MSEENIEDIVSAGGATEEIKIEDEMSRDYIEYSMSVIVG